MAFLGDSENAFKILGADNKIYEVPKSLAPDYKPDLLTPEINPQNVAAISNPAASQAPSLLDSYQEARTSGLKPVSTSQGVQQLMPDLVNQITPQPSQAIQQQEGIPVQQTLPQEQLSGKFDQTKPQVNVASEKMGLVSDLMAPLQTGIAGAKQEYEASKELGKKQADIYSKQMASQALEDDLHKSVMNDISKRIDDSNQKFQDMSDQYMRHSAVDPNRFYKNLDTGSKIQTGIGLILGGIGAGLTGGENLALKVINNAIDRDIQSQMSDVDKLKTGVEMQGSMVGKLYQQFQNKDLAYNAAKKMNLDNVEMQLKTAAAQTSDPIAKARLLQSMSQIQMQSAQMMMPIKQFMLQQAMLGSGSNGGNPLQRISALQDKEVKDAALKELPLWKQHEANKSLMNDSLRIMNENRFSPIGTEGYNKFQQAKTILLSNTSELFGGKSEQEFKIMEGLTPGATWNAKAYQNAVGLLNKKADSMKSFPVLEDLGIAKKSQSAIHSFKAGQ